MSEQNIRKFQVTIHFKVDSQFMARIPPHRLYISRLIENGVLDYYSVSLESMRVWMVMSAVDKDQVDKLLSESPLYSYFKIEIDELYVYDAAGYRLPSFQLN
jgi:hypothetical protein